MLVREAQLSAGGCWPKSMGLLAAPRLLAPSQHRGPAAPAPRCSGSDEQPVIWQSNYCQAKHAAARAEIGFEAVGSNSPGSTGRWMGNSRKEVFLAALQSSFGRAEIRH